ncbi:MAG: hypothetical protein K2F81_02195 [Ruminococcus sp.]|nr:hypothetical protein [Ruminococcus sp.]
MKIFRFIIKKDLPLLAIVTLILIIFSGTIQLLKYKEAYQYEPYYSHAFQKLSTDNDFYQTLSNELAQANAESDNVYNEIFDFMYGEEYDPYTPPREIPSIMIEKLFVPSDDGGKYTPLAETDAKMLFQMSEQIDSQSNYKQLIADQIENYDRNSRRGIKDEYILKTAAKLKEDYSNVLQNKFDKPVDTRAGNVLITYLTTDFIPFFAAFILLFHRLSSEIQSRRLMQFSISKFGAVKFTISKTLTGLIEFFMFYIIYCLSSVAIFLTFDNKSGVLSAPLQVISQYELSPEALSVFQYIMAIMLTKLVYCIALGALIMLISFLCKKIIFSAAVGIIITTIPLLISKTYDSLSADLDRQKIKIIFSCDIYNMYHNLNYINLFGSPVKIYWLFLSVLIAVAAVSTVTLALYSRKRGAAYV